MKIGKWVIVASILALLIYAISIFDIHNTGIQFFAGCGIITVLAGAFAGLSYLILSKEW